VFVIFGANGNVGKACATALRRAGHDVRAVLRSPAHAAPLAEIGCDIAIADLRDRTAMARALDGARAVQILCPVPRDHADPAREMRSTIDASVDALRANLPEHVLALSDYGAEHASGTGITTLFHASARSTPGSRSCVPPSTCRTGRACYPLLCPPARCRVFIIRSISAFLPSPRKTSAHWPLTCCWTRNRHSMRRAW